MRIVNSNSTKDEEGQLICGADANI